MGGFSLPGSGGSSQLFNFAPPSGSNPTASSNQYFSTLPPSSTFGMQLPPPVTSSSPATYPTAFASPTSGAIPSPASAQQNPGGMGPAPGAAPVISGQQPTGVPPGAIPPSTSSSAPTSTVWGGLAPWGNNMLGQGTLDPSLTNSLEGYLQSQVGQGVAPFNQATPLPWGGTTQPGQVNAPLDPVMQELLSGFTGGGGGFGGIPGMGTLSSVAQNGINAVPAWQQMVAAQQQQIQQGAANLAEQFNVGGGLVGSPYGNAAAGYQQQSNLDLNSLLANMQYQGIGEQLGAANTLAGMGQSFGQGLQTEGQQNIQNMMQQYLMSLPQYNPLLANEQNLATTFQPVVQKGSTGGGTAGAVIGGLGTLAELAPLLGI
jgi:hypothetical protein